MILPKKSIFFYEDEKSQEQRFGTIVFYAGIGQLVISGKRKQGILNAPTFYFISLILLYCEQNEEIIK